MTRYIIPLLILLLSCVFTVHVAGLFIAALELRAGYGLELLLTLGGATATLLALFAFFTAKLLRHIWFNILLAASSLTLLVCFFTFLAFQSRLSRPISPSPDVQYLPESYSADTETDLTSTPKSTDAEENIPIDPPSTILLPVPYINEAPDDNWTGSWKNGCEEASVAMAHFYYNGRNEVSIDEAKSFMQTLFDVQQENYGSDANSNTARTLEFIKSHANFDAQIVENPSIEDIKNELQEGRPVIAFHHGFDLQNPNIPFLATGSSFHVTVVVGYDDDARQFIVHDDGDRIQGPNHLYDYDLFMNTLHDYQYETGLADGPPRVLFTRAH